LLKYSKSFKKIFIIISFIILLIFAKDNVIIELRTLFFPKSLSPTTMSAKGTIEVAFSPNQKVTALIIKALAQARSVILVSAYSFTSKDLAQALLDAKKRHVKIKIILDKSQLSQRYSSSSFFANQGFDLRIDGKHAIFHNKIMIIDDNTVITGSFNFTKAAETKNAENLLIIRDNPALARLYTQNFWLHWNEALPYPEAKVFKN
jgi:phosphatidylserine/phosphatidylglycerophosphate/cardiolipin synthase-like enzyme